MSSSSGEAPKEGQTAEGGGDNKGILETVGGAAKASAEAVKDAAVFAKDAAGATMYTTAKSGAGVHQAAGKNDNVH